MFRRTVKVLLFSLFLLMPAARCLFASTIGIATGNTTVDGRPLLFKTKDRADNYPSDLDYYPGNSSSYAYVFQKNDGDDHTRARMGLNDAGFGIVYTTSENLTGMGFGLNGSEFAAIALKKCNCIQAFRDLLGQTQDIRDVHEHYGIIDSSGAGGLFEVDGQTHVEIQIVDSIGTMANTAKYHPNAGPPASGSTSPEREARVAYLLQNVSQGNLDYRYFINEVMKDFCTIQADEDRMPDGQYKTNAVISRYKTAAACVIKGCRPGDDPLVEPVMWLVPGEPSFSVAFPMLINAPQIYSELRISAAGDGMAGSIDKMRSLIYDYSGGRYSDLYADTDKLMEIRQTTFPLQNYLSDSYDQMLMQWRVFSAQSVQQSMQDWVLEKQEWTKNQFDSLYEEIITEIASPDGLPILRTPEIQIFPNPFNSNTMISIFWQGVSEDVRLLIYNIQGRMVRELELTNRGKKENIVQWDGKDMYSKTVPSGIYFCTITSANYAQSKKMVLLK